MEHKEYVFISDEDPLQEASYLLIKRIGKGGYSTVYLCENLIDKKQYAMKVYSDTIPIQDKKREINLNDARVITQV